VVHPLVGVTLGIATGGLSCAAFGIYRGVTVRKMKKKAAKEAAAAGNGMEQSELGGRAEMMQSSAEKDSWSTQGGYAVPSPVSAVTPRTRFGPADDDAQTLVSELEGSGSSFVNPQRRSSIPVSEIDGSPVSPAPPRYSEIAGTLVVEKGSEAGVDRR
jgi:hypothetical protein